MEHCFRENLENIIASLSKV